MQHLFADCMCKNLITGQPNRQTCQQFIDSVSNPYSARTVEIHDTHVSCEGKEAPLSEGITFWQLYQSIETISGI